MTVRVLLVDDHPVVREGLRSLLHAEPGIAVVGECASGVAAVPAAIALDPDVVLMDLRMPDGDGAAATAAIVASCRARVVVLTTYDTDGEVLRAIEAGATGYLLKDTPPAQLAEAVRAAARGETVLAPLVAARLVDVVRGASRGTGAGVLTPRETEVLRHVARGASNSDVGRALHIGEATVKSHLLRVFEKLQVGDRTAAVTVAMARGILPPPDGR